MVLLKIFIGMNTSCNLNYQHSMIYNELAERFEITEDVSRADKIVLSTSCCNTKYHILSLIQYIQSILYKKKETTPIYLTGCITREFTNPELIKINNWLKNNVDYIIPQNQPNLLLRLIDQKAFGMLDIDDFGSACLAEDIKTTSMYISNGCYNNCSFCKTTFQNYPVKSIPLNEIKDEIDQLNENGVSKLQLIGTNICQYGLDIKREYLLPELIEYVEQKENITVLELIGFAFKDAIHNQFQNTLKMSSKTTLISGSIESGSDRILKLMRKGFTVEELLNFVTNINEITPKNLIVNIISGFPTEKFEDIRMTLDVLKFLNPQKVFLCRYMNSPFVDSNQFEQLIPTEIQEHTKIYSKVLQQRNIDYQIVGNGYQYNLYF